MATIDERVVSLKLNNKQFLSAIKESAAGMDKLKSSLKLDGAANGLQRIGEIARNTTLGDLARSAMDAVSNMSVMQGVGVAALGGIGAAALSAGQSIVQGMIQPMIDGFHEYETQINAVQTILANTSQNGTTLDQVNSALDELNSYADKTIYNFTEMTSAIGTFTVAGIGLEEATASVKGFSNVAALSGANATQAAGAMYQLAQAMSSGVVKLQDWMSIEKAGIGGKQFQEALIETARVQGQAVDEAIAKNGNFRLSLQEGWLTAQVMTQTLTALTNDLSEAQLIEMGYSEEQAAKMKELAQKAFDSATQIRTFSQLVGTISEAIGSGWAKTWQIIIGDFGEAQALFTSVGNWITSFIDDMNSARNSTLETWAAMGGRTEVLRGLQNIFMAIVKVIGQVIDGFRAAFSGPTGESLYNMSKAFADFTEKLIITDNFAHKLQGTFSGLFSIFHIVWTIITEIGQVIFTVFGHLFSAIFPVFTGMNSGIFELTKWVGLAINAFDKWFTKLDIGGKVLKLLLPPIDLLGKAIKWVVERIHDFFMWLDVGGRLKKAGESFGGLGEKIELVKQAFANSALGKQFIAAIESVQSAVDKAKTKIQEFGKTIYDKLAGKLNGAKAALSDYFQGFNLGDMSSMDSIVSSLGDKFDKLGEKLKITEKVEWLKEKLIELKDAIVELWNKVEGSDIWPKLGAKFEAAGNKAKELALSFRDWINGQGDVKQKAQEAGQAVASVGTATADAAKEAGEAAKQNFLLKWLEDIKQVAQDLHLPELFETIKQKFEEIKNYFTQTLAPKIKEGASKALDGIGEAFSKANENLKSYDMGKILVGAVGSGTLYAFIKWIKSFTENFDKIGSLADSLSGVFNKLGDVLGAFEKQINAESLRIIAISLLLLAASLVVMSLVPAPKLLMTVGVLYALSKVLNGMLEELGNLSRTGILRIRAVVPMLLVLSLALILVAVAVKKLGEMNAADAIQGVVALRFILDGLIEFVESIKDPKKLTQGAGILLGLAGACLILSLAVFALGSMPLGTVLQGVITLGVVIGMLTGFMYIVGQNNSIKKGAGILLGLAVSVNILVSAIAVLGLLPLDNLIQGVVAVGVLVGILAAAMYVASKTDASGAATVLAMVVAVVALTYAVQKLGEMELADLAKGLIALAAGLAIMVAAMYGAQQFAVGAALLAAAGIAIAIFANSLVNLGQLNWVQVAIGLVALAGGLAIFLAAAFVAQFVAPGLILLTAVLIALGIALLPISIGMAAFAAVLGICATTGAAAFVVLEAGIKSLIQLLPTIAQKLAEAIAAFIIELGSKAPEIGVAMALLIGALIYAIDANIPGVVAAIFNLISALLTELDNHAYEFGAKATNAIANFIQGIADNIQKVIDAGTDLIVNFLRGIGDSYPRIIDEAANTLLKFLEGLRDAINKYSARFRTVGREIAWAIIDGITGGLANKAWEIGEKMVNAAKNGYNRVKNFFGIHSPSRLMKVLGGYVGEGLAIGMEQTGERIGEAGETIGQTAYDAMKASLDDVNDLIEDDPSYKPEIKPILDLEEMQKQAQGIDNLMPALTGTLSAANGARPRSIASDPSNKINEPGVTNITFNQTNNSPEALDPAVIYRQTKTQLAMAKDKLTV